MSQDDSILDPSFQDKAITETYHLLSLAGDALKQLEQGVHRSRHRSLAITHMEDVVARLEMDLRQLRCLNKG